MKKIISVLRSPIDKETRLLLSKRWSTLDPKIQTPNQMVGQHWVQCGFITGPTYCSFGCTHCYLPKDANHKNPPSIDEIKMQIDANRKMLGPGGHIQITGGDLVDAYVRDGRFDDLVELIRYANEVNLVPMLMTHGQELLDNPKLLEQLVTDGGLRKICIHVDITQTGRKNYSIKNLSRESDLHPLRDLFTRLILNIRKQTGKRLVGAQTVTVTERNIHSIKDILGWHTADPKNLSAFNLISFQTEADVGRTRISQNPITPELVWRNLCQAAGHQLARDTFSIGHPDCSSMAILAVDGRNNRLIDLMKPAKQAHQFWNTLISDFGGLGGRTSSPFIDILRKLAILFRRPLIIIYFLQYFYALLKYADYRVDWIKAILFGQLGFSKLVMHNFIDANKLQSPIADSVQQRLNACSFRGAVKIGKDWQPVPMCMMNSRYR